MAVILMSDLKRPVSPSFQKGLIRNHLTNLLKDGEWAGRPGYVFAGGPSAAKFQESWMKGFKVIGCNFIIKRFVPDLLFFFDLPVWTDTEEGRHGEVAKRNFASPELIRVTAPHTQTPLPPDIYTVMIGVEEPSLPVSLGESICHGGNSGHVSLCLAYLLGLNPIYLLGFDLNTEGIAHWWHGDTSDDGHRDRHPRFRMYMESLIAMIRQAGTEVVNLSSTSTLTSAPKWHVEEVMKRHNCRPEYFTSSRGMAVQTGEKVGLTVSLNGGIPQETSLLRCDIMLRRLLDAKQPQVYVESGSIFHRKPEEFEHFREVDLAVPAVNGHYDTSLLFASNTQVARDLMREWLQYQKAKPKEPEDVTFKAVFDGMKSRMKYVLLSEEYAYDSERNKLRFFEKPIVSVKGIDQPVVVSSSLEEQEEERYRIAWQTGNQTRSACAKPFARFIEMCETVKKSHKILELGSGDGIVISLLHDSGYNIQGVDITTAGLQKAGLFEFIQKAPLWHMPMFLDKTFDIVVSTDVLEHIPTEKVDEVLKEITRVTKPNGFHLHVIADFPDREFHATVKPVEWWKEKFKTTGLRFQLMSRNQFLEIQKEKEKNGRHTTGNGPKRKK